MPRGQVGSLRCGRVWTSAPWTRNAVGTCLRVNRPREVSPHGFSQHLGFLAGRHRAGHRAPLPIEGEAAAGGGFDADVLAAGVAGESAARAVSALKAIAVAAAALADF